MALELKNSDTAKLYDCTYETEVRVLVPGVYKGPLSAVTPEVAEVLIAQGHKALVRKPADTKQDNQEDGDSL